MKNLILKVVIIVLFLGLFIMGCEDNLVEEVGECIDEVIIDI